MVKIYDDFMSFDSVKSSFTRVTSEKASDFLDVPKFWTLYSPFLKLVPVWSVQAETQNTVLSQFVFLSFATI